MSEKSAGDPLNPDQPTGEQNCNSPGEEMQTATEESVESPAQPDSAPQGQKIGQPEGEQPPVPSAATIDRLQKGDIPKIARTILDKNVLTKVGAQLSAPKVARTILDKDALRRVAAQLSSEKEFRLREQIETQSATGEVKKFQTIENFREASLCGIPWEKMKGTDRVRFCEQCQLQVYDFTKIELPEAEELIFKRENRRGAVLFRRSDGTFLTSDCPIGARRKQTIVLAIAGTALLIFGVIALLSLSPRPPKPTTVHSPEALTSSPTAASPGNQSPSTPRAGATIGGSGQLPPPMNPPSLSRQLPPPMNPPSWTGQYPTQTTPPPLSGQFPSPTNAPPSGGQYSAPITNPVQQNQAPNAGTGNPTPVGSTAQPGQAPTAGVEPAATGAVPPAESNAPANDPQPRFRTTEPPPTANTGSPEQQ